jgi:hypothetical protein
MKAIAFLVCRSMTATASRKDHIALGSLNLLRRGMGLMFACAVFLSLVAGCGTLRSKPPVTVSNGTPITQFSEKDFGAAQEEYRAAMERLDYDKATVVRDRTIFRIRVDVDGWFADLEERLYQQRAGFNTLADFAELGLAGAGALTHGEHAKTVLATILGVGKGTRLSYDKNWFREKGTESLINAMRAGRNSKLAGILNKMTANRANKYTLEEAWSDMIAYYQAGTLQGGLLSLLANTGEQAAKSEQTVKAANEARYPALISATPAMIAENEQAVDKAMRLPVDKLRALLNDLNVAVPANADASALRALINTYVQTLLTATPDERKNFIDAVRKY